MVCAALPLTTTQNFCPSVVFNNALMLDICDFESKNITVVSLFVRRADHSSKGVLPSILIRLRNLQCEAARVLTRTVEPLMMMISTCTRIMNIQSKYVFLDTFIENIDAYRAPKTFKKRCAFTLNILQACILIVHLNNPY
jgi:hypothetical protein